jgi:cellulose biosynthesis protein BcsQ
MKVVAVTNIKGGVGKTTTAVNLCGERVAVFIVDLDPQGAATYVLRCEPQEETSVKKLVSGKRELNELVVASGHQRLDVLPADFSYRRFDVQLPNRHLRPWLIPRSSVTCRGSRHRIKRAGRILLFGSRGDQRLSWRHAHPAK